MHTQAHALKQINLAFVLLSTTEEEGNSSKRRLLKTFCRLESSFCANRDATKWHVGLETVS